jgi:hypothetical protein
MKPKENTNKGEKFDKETKKKVEENIDGRQETSKSETIKEISE